MSDKDNHGLDIRCHSPGCDRQAVVIWKQTPLCAPHYHERVEPGILHEPVNTRAGQLEHGINRHP